MNAKQTGASGLIDPFIASKPAVLVHEIDPSVFDDMWRREPTGLRDALCPVCGGGTASDRGISPAKHREWIEFSCGDVVTAEITAG
jgi:hypothetical protein